jgi:hypothetical protein
MNSFTLEASFNGFIDEKRDTVEFNTSSFLEMGKCLSLALLDYVKILEAERIR